MKSLNLFPIIGNDTILSLISHPIDCRLPFTSDNFVMTILLSKLV